MKHLMLVSVVVLVLATACISAPTPTPVPPTATALLPTATPIPQTSTPLPTATATRVPPTATATNIPLMPTPTPKPLPGTPAPTSIWQGFSYDGTYTVDIDSPVALLDTPIKIRVTGLKAKQPITLRAKFTDHKNQVWESFATFIADDKGSVDVSNAVPIYGSYVKADAMGLFWSMLPVGANNPESVGVVWTTLDPTIIKLTAEAADKTLATVEVKRQRILEDKVKRQSVRTDGIVGTLFYPTTPGMYPTVITLGGSEGGLGESRARLLASRGYTAFALAYFGFETLPKELVELPLEYFAKAIAWLKTQPSVNPDQIVVMGTSKGGELALLLSATYPQDIKGTIAYVPSAVVYRGLYSGQTNRSSWTLGGKPVPFLGFAYTPECIALANKKPPVYNCVYGKALENVAAVATASIAVEKINGPVLLLSGTDDQVWPSAQFSEMVMARLKAKNFAFTYEHLRYEGAGHFIGVPFLPSNQTQTADLVGGGTAEANGTASADSYIKVLDFLKKQIK